MAFTPYTNRPIRPSPNFMVLYGGVLNSTFFMTASQSGVAGSAMVYTTTDYQVDVASVAQTPKKNLAGFLLSEVRDLSAQQGRRNWTYSNIQNFSDNVTLVQGEFVAKTRTYTGTPTVGQYLENDANGYLAATSLTGSGLSNALMSGVILAVVEAGSDGQLNPDTGVETAQGGQTTPSNQNYIQIRVF